MLKNFKNNKSTKRVENAKKQKAIAVAKKQVLSPPSSDTDADSDSDSDYEEILISGINGKPQKKQADATVKPPEPVDDANHANHFQKPPVEEELKVSAPIPIPPRRKEKSTKKVVIKKYYQKRVQDPPPPVTPHVPHVPPTRTSYIGISSIDTQHRKPVTNAHSTMSSRILNW